MLQSINRRFAIPFILAILFAFGWFPNISGYDAIPLAYAADFTVDDTNDTKDANPGDGICADSLGNCTLRAAIEESNDLFGPDTINVPAGNYILQDLGGYNPGLEISDDGLTITGAGTESTIIDADQIGRVVSINSEDITLSNLTIQGGRVEGFDGGGGIQVYESAQAYLTDVIVRDNYGEERGGGIFSVGDLSLHNVQVISNTANGIGGGIYLTSGQLTQTGVTTVAYNNSSSGGGLYISGEATFNNLQVISNSSEFDGGGIYIDQDEYDVVFVDGRIVGNTITNGSNGGGGGVYIRGSGYGFNGRFIQTGDTLIANNTTDTFGGGLYVSQGGISLDGAKIFNNQPVFNSANDAYGGGIYLENSQATLTKVHIYSNTADFGGGMAINTVSTDPDWIVSLNKIAIQNNSADNDGGGLYIEGQNPYGDENHFNQTGAITLAHNIANRNGGGLYIKEEVLQLNQIYVFNNIAHGEYINNGGGGGGYLEYSSLILNGGEIISNTATEGNGGGIQVYGYDWNELSINDGKVDKNIAKGCGGGIYVNYAQIQIIDSDINQNISYSEDYDGGGGGICFDTTEGDLRLTDTNVISNKAISQHDDGYGGGIYSKSDVYIHGGQILYNQAGSGGGGLFVSSEILSQTGNTLIAYNQISKEQGGTGAGIDYSRGYLYLDGATVLSNTNGSTEFAYYQSQGGGIYASNSQIDFNDVTVRENWAGSGGGIYINGADYYNYDNINPAPIMLHGGEFLNNKVAMNGAGLYISGQGFYNQSFVLSQTGVITVMNNDSLEGSGGGLYLTQGDFYFSQVFIHGNSAGGQSDCYGGDGGGGGICATDQAYLIIDNGEISDNHTERNGGGINNGDAWLSINQTQILDNSATEAGGGLYANGKVSLNNSQIMNNRSDYSGGGGIYIYHHAEIVTLTDTQIISNAASDSSGGGIYAGGPLKIIGGTILSNTAEYEGGGLLIDGQATLTGTKISDNHSTGSYGGGIVIDYGSAVLTNLLLLSNTAATEGGAIYQTYAGSTTMYDSCVVNNSDTSVTSENDSALTATNNWWGSEDGPSGAGSGNGDSVGLGVNFTNYTSIPPTGCPTLPEPAVVTVTSTANVLTTTHNETVIYNLRLETDGTVNGPLTLAVIVPPGTTCTNTNDNGYSGWFHNPNSCATQGIARFDLLSNAQLIAGQPITLSYQVTVTATGPTTLFEGAIELSGDSLPTTVVTGTSIIDVFVSSSEVAISGLTASNNGPTARGHNTTLQAQITAGSNISYSWGLGDGSVGTGATINHTYPAKGNYQAIVTATNPLNTLTATTIIKIIDAPIQGLAISYDGPTLLGNPTTLQANTSAGDNVSYTWNFGDGTTDTGAEVTHNYAQAGLYTVIVTASNQAGSTSTTIQAEVNETITGLTVTTNSPIHLGETSLLSATVATGNNLTYQWDLGDGTVKHKAMVTHTYTETGLYTATVIVSNTVNNVSQTTLITVLGLPELAISKTGPTVAQVNQPISYTLTVVNQGNGLATNLIITDHIPVGAIYVAGGTLVDDVVQWIIPTLAEGEAISVSFTVTATSRITNQTYEVVADETGPVTGIDIVVTEILQPISGLQLLSNSPTELGQPISFSTTLASGDQVIHSWHFGDGTGEQGGLQNSTISHIYQNLGVYQVMVIASNPVSIMTATTQVTITEAKLRGLTISNDSPTMIGDITQLQASVTTGNNVDYQWDLGDGTITMGTTINHVYPTTGTFTVIVTTTNNTSTLTATTTVYITDQPVADLIKLSISKDGPNQVAPAQPIEYILTVVNEGTLTATNLLIRDQLPEGAFYLHGGTLNDDVVQWSIPALPPQESMTMTFIVTAETTIVNSSYQVTADGGYQATGEQVVVTVIQGSTNPTRGSVMGVVKANTTGELLPNISVTIYRNIGSWWGWYTVRKTNQQGFYQFQNLPPGQYRLLFADYQPPRRYLSEYYHEAERLSEATIITVPAGEITNINAGLDMGGRIRGTIRDKAGNPVTNVSVHVKRFVDGAASGFWSAVVRPTADGSYLIEGLRQGDYLVKVIDQNDSPQQVTTYYPNVTAINEATFVEITPNSTITNINITMQDGGTLQGTVTNQQNNPIANITVRAEQYNGRWWELVKETETDHNGAYQLTALNGNYRIQFMDWYRWPNRYLNKIYPDVTVEAEKVVTLDTTLDKPGRVIGRITWVDGQSITNMQVKLFHEVNGSWQTVAQTSQIDSHGYYQVGNLSAGVYRVGLVGYWNNEVITYYQSAPTIDTATDVVVAVNSITTGIDFVLPLPVPPLVDVSIQRPGNQIVNPLTGMVAIRANGSDVTITKQVICADESIPSEVILTMVGVRSYPMTLDPEMENQYTTTIPNEDIPIGWGDDYLFTLQISVTCSGQTETEIVGTIFWDPGGLVTDINTNEPVIDAIVTLYNVPDWQPKTSSDDNTPNTCQSHLSKTADTLWNQPAPVEEGIVGLPESNSFDPAINPQLTTVDGRYAWDVAEGCWYVVVQAEGYQTLISPVVGVPPEVTDLDVVLTPIPRLRFSQLNYEIAEIDGLATITVTSGSPVTQTTTVDYTIIDHTAKAGLDYQPISGTLTFKVGESNQTFTVPIIMDNIGEPLEIAILQLTNANGTSLGIHRETYLTITADNKHQETDTIYLPMLYKIGLQK